MSLPSWERGLKSFIWDHTYIDNSVAPLVGAWIEIANRQESVPAVTVAPLVGAWIEMQFQLHQVSDMSSLPSWERGLK